MGASFIIFLIIILVALAIVDLVVGVSNDAVNFLNSAIGSRVASFKTVMIIASVGVILGAMFSSGIMEIARKGVFNPAHFTFDKLLLVFVAVMLTDIILLDVFNTLGLPTSTTVSIIFELLGASLTAGLLLSAEKQEAFSEVSKYINGDGVMTIISGIFLSILIAFTLGMIVQYLSRLLFTFDYEEKLARYGAPYSAIGITIIIYFLLIKGLKGTVLITPEAAQFIETNTWLILLAIAAVAWLLLWMLQRHMKINPLRIVVLMGTFSLAMAFAGNDLVNFIGVPITGYLAFVDWRQSGQAADAYYETYLAGNDVIVPWYMLLAAGIIMALTLWLSSKAKKVTETEVNLGSQHEGEERFQPNAVSRSIVKTSMLLAKTFKVILPTNMLRYYDISFKKSKIKQATIVHDKPAFDMVRASANLILASAIIALATSYKLPLSTTYVSFMVAMGTSLADKAWGRESAVYRVAGVLSVIGGWFVTAIIAFTVASLFVFIMVRGGQISILILLAVVALYVVFSHWYFTKKTKEEKLGKEKVPVLSLDAQDLFEANRKYTAQHLYEAAKLYQHLMRATRNYSDSEMTEASKAMTSLHAYSQSMKAGTIRGIKQLKGAGNKLPRVMLYSADLADDMFSSIQIMGNEMAEYVQNLHEPTLPYFEKLSTELETRLLAFVYAVALAIEQPDFTNIHVIKAARDDVREFINGELDKAVDHIQQQNPGTKQAMLRTTVLLQSRDVVAVTYRMYNLYRRYFGA